MLTTVREILERFEKHAVLRAEEAVELLVVEAKTKAVKRNFNLFQIAPYYDKPAELGYYNFVRNIAAIDGVGVGLTEQVRLDMSKIEKVKNTAKNTALAAHNKLIHALEDALGVYTKIGLIGSYVQKHGLLHVENTSGNINKYRIQMTVNLNKEGEVESKFHWRRIQN